jgi:hypothetical protein
MDENEKKVQEMRRLHQQIYAQYKNSSTDVKQPVTNPFQSSSNLARSVTMIQHTIQGKENKPTDDMFSKYAYDP